MVKHPPGYREGSPEENCGNCGAFQGYKLTQGLGHCFMYNRTVKKVKTCDKWYPIGGEKPSA